ncbi:proline-rich proteoglycan 2-like [Periplaneta americana]|uniref:proline-rich proteoglycan 2-like n=1 Tax=Periplaneta americana TaxID=6978 RepID=UPI0037E7C12D
MTDKDVSHLRWQLVSLAAVMFTFSTARAEPENKWVWSGSGRNIGGTAPYYAEDVARPLYRPGGNGYRPPAPVFEVTDFTNPPPLLQPSRPVTRPPNNYRPIDGPRPGGPGIFTGPDGPRPVGPGVLTGPDGPRPGGSGIFTGPDNQRPGGSGILTGPVPSWEQRPGDKYAYKDYEHCKCVFAFNCPSPGIKFGQCDAGKQYCCFSPKPNGNGGLPPVNRGPGVGYGDASIRPTYARPILVGPGGPTGIVSEGGRPFKPPGDLYRPLGREDIDENYRPNGRPYQGYGTINDERFPRPPFDPYARSANLETKKNGKKL